MSTSHRIGVCSWDRLGHAHSGLVGLGENGYPLTRFKRSFPAVLWITRGLKKISLELTLFDS